MSELETANRIIREIYEKYAENSYMLNRSHNYICEQLPTILENMCKEHEQRQLRIEELSNEQDHFIQSFLNNNQYFYCPSSEQFFFYDGINYQLCKEDKLLHTILSTISKGRQLLVWKQKTKNNVMKRIKENIVFKSVPESETIQNVLEMLCPAVFSTKVETKYFLTILGDNIFKKKQDIVHFISSKAKPFLRELNNISQIYFNINTVQSFRYKYHEHDYVNCRLVHINSSIKSENVMENIFQKNILDLFCVACHYSIRYGNSDDYVTNISNDNTLIENAFYLKNIQPEDLVNHFVSDILQINGNVRSNTSATTQISWKNMQYLWKNYLDGKHLPMIMFQNTLKQFLIQKLGDCYTAENDTFIGICSKYLPEIQKFVSFWEETITYDENENETEFEMDELCGLFKKWCLQKKETLSYMNDIQILDLVTYFYPHVEIEREKFIYKIRSSMWDKQFDIQIALQNMKEKYKNTESDISIYDAYLCYWNYYKPDNGIISYIASKSYFEKYVFEYLADFIVDMKFISREWFL